jgi:predicted TIM-barrel fold metal-dependent hydrolase
MNTIMKHDRLAQDLMEQIEQIEAVDCHEHLMPEAERTSQDVDVFTLFSHYTQGDLRAAGMNESACASLQDTRLPLDYRWALFEPYWQHIRHTSYSRAALIALQKFYGHEDFTSENYQQISAAIQKANVPGLYRRILKETCRLKTALLQVPFAEVDRAYFIPVVHYPFCAQHDTWTSISHPEFMPDAAIRSIDDYLHAAWDCLVQAKNKGAVAVKMFVQPNAPPERSAAITIFRKLQDGELAVLPLENALTDYLFDQMIAYAGKLDLVVAVHTGYWKDFRQLSPLHMIPILQRHPQTRFDIYHLGFPWGRETLMLGKGFPNVWLNLCWTHIISQRFTQQAMSEALDLVPVNKIFAFGGDYGKPVEKVFGHLTMARENLALVMADRVKSGQISASQAIRIAEMWLQGNPKDFYNLKFS